MKFRIKSKAPRRTATILMMGPPGARRTKIARLLARKYGLVHVSTGQMIKDQIAKKTEVGRECLERIKKGELVEDEIVLSLVHSRISRTDCLTHGYILDGFPKTPDQIKMFEDLKIVPSFIILLEMTDKDAKKTLGERRIDPQKGVIYDQDLAPPEEILPRLRRLPEDETGQVKKRWVKFWALLDL